MEHGDLCKKFIAEDHRYFLNVAKWGTQGLWPDPMCTIRSAQRTRVFLRLGTYAESSSQRSEVQSKRGKVGYSATLARAHVQRFMCSQNRGLPSLGDLCRGVI